MRTCAARARTRSRSRLSVLGVVIMAGSLSLTEIVAAQADTPGTRSRRSSVSSSSSSPAPPRPRAPFDLPEAEQQELVAGYHTEYGGMRFGLYTMSEYINLITLSGLCVTLFLGGWQGRAGTAVGLAPIWSLVKLAVLLYVFIWMRTTLPRLRYDQLMRFGWKVLLPVATVNAIVTAILVVACESSRSTR